jgi:hypothetical protein
MSAYDAQVLTRGAETYFPFNETSGIPVDVVGGKLLTQVGSPTLGATGLCMDGEHAISFTLNDCYTMSDAPIADLTADWSLTYFVEWIGSQGGSGAIVPFIGGALSTPYIFIYYNGASIRVVGQPSGGDHSFGLGNPMESNPVQVGLSYKASTSALQLYLNGTPGPLGPIAGYTNSNTNPGAYFGLTSALSGSNYFQGKLAKMAFYPSCLADSDFAADYAASQSTGPPPPVRNRVRRAMLFTS